MPTQQWLRLVRFVLSGLSQSDMQPAVPFGFLRRLSPAGRKPFSKFCWLGDRVECLSHAPPATASGSRELNLKYLKVSDIRDSTHLWSWQQPQHNELKSD